MSSEEPSRLESLDSLFGGVAKAIGADPPGSVARELSDRDRRALDHLLSLVGQWGVLHTLNTSGMVLVAVDEGERMLVLEPRLLGEEEWINLTVYLLRDLPDDPEVRARVDRVVMECNRYYGAKFVLVGDELRAIIDIPARGIDSDALLTAAKRLIWVIADAAKDLESIGAGRLVESWKPQGLPTSRALKTPRLNDE